MESSWSISYFEQNADYCRNILQQGHIWKSIPILKERTNLKHYENKLVRLKGMVQDIKSPVYYSEHYEIFNSSSNSTSVRSGKYRDLVACSENETLISESGALKECQVVYCIDVPALNKWAREAWDSQPTEEEYRPEDEDVMEIEKKRCRLDALDEQDTAVNPIYKESGILVNLYDTDGDKIKLNEVIDIVGFLSLTRTCQQDPYLDEDHNCSVTGNCCIVSPKIHSIMCWPYDTPFPPVPLNAMLENEVLAARQNLQQILTEAFAGDELAANYMICHLISSVFCRTGLIAHGKFSINFVNVPDTSCDSQYTLHMYKLISQLVEKSEYFSVSITSLNTTVMVPRKDYEKDCLVRGLLQLSSGTHLFLDETTLHDGRLENRGVCNKKALDSIVDSQCLDYDFQFYTVPFNTDIPIISFSKGKSLFQSDCCLPLRTSVSGAENLSAFFSHVFADTNWQPVRRYVQYVRSLCYDISPNMSNIISEDFVSMRQKKEYNIGADDLNIMLLIARLMSLSYGKTLLSQREWNTACMMETERRKRLSSI